VITLLGLLLWTIGGLYLTTDASADQPFTPAGGIVSSLGMIVYGIAAIRAGAAGKLRRFVPVLVGVWFFLQLPLQIAFFFPVGGSPSFLLLLGVLGALWALTGYVVRSGESEGRRRLAALARGRPADQTTGTSRCASNSSHRAAQSPDDLTQSAVESGASGRMPPPTPPRRPGAPCSLVKPQRTLCTQRARPGATALFAATPVGRLALRANGYGTLIPRRSSADRGMSDPLTQLSRID